MRLNKKEGIFFLEHIGLPTVKTINLNSLSNQSIDLQKGLSVRLSPKGEANINVNLPSIHNCKDLSKINQFVEEYKNKYDIIVHKTVNPDVIGSVSKLQYRESIVLETFRDFKERKEEIISNRMIIPLFGGRMYLSQMEIMNKDKNDFCNFCKIVPMLKDIPFDEYDMEYVIEDGRVIFTDLTLPNNREYSSFKECMEDRDK